MNTTPHSPIDDLASHAGDASRLLKNLANEHRLTVLCTLAQAQCEMTVTELLNMSALSASALSQHLARLREDKLVATRRQGQTIYYRVVEGPALQLIQVLKQHFCATSHEDEDTQ